MEEVLAALENGAAKLEQVKTSRRKKREEDHQAIIQELKTLKTKLKLDRGKTAQKRADLKISIEHMINEARSFLKMESNHILAQKLAQLSEIEEGLSRLQTEVHAYITNDYKKFLHDKIGRIGETFKQAHKIFEQQEAKEQVEYSGKNDAIELTNKLAKTALSKLSKDGEELLGEDLAQHIEDSMHRLSSKLQVFQANINKQLNSCEEHLSELTPERTQEDKARLSRLTELIEKMNNVCQTITQ